MNVRFQPVDLVDAITGEKVCISEVRDDLSSPYAVETYYSSETGSRYFKLKNCKLTFAHNSSGFIGSPSYYVCIESSPDIELMLEELTSLSDDFRVRLPYEWAKHEHDALRVRADWSVGPEVSPSDSHQLGFFVDGERIPDPIRSGYAMRNLGKVMIGDAGITVQADVNDACATKMVKLTIYSFDKRA